jgi:hypothetical protein
MPLTKIEAQTAGAGASITEIDFESLGTAHELLFTWVNFDPTGGSDDTLSFQVTTSSYDYNAPINSAYARGYHRENDTAANMATYDSGSLSNGTGLQWLGSYVDQDAADSSSSGELRLFSHTNTSLVKNFISMSSTETDAAYHAHIGGYVNTTEAITKVRFKALAGGTFTGIFTLYEYT